MHGERGGSLHFAAGFDVAIGRAHDAPEVDARVGVEILVFDGDERVAQDLRIVVVGGDDAALQGEGADHAALRVVEFGNRTGAIAFQFIDLGQVGGIHENEPRRRAHRGREQNQQSVEDDANQFPSGGFCRRRVLIGKCH